MLTLDGISTTHQPLTESRPLTEISIGVEDSIDLADNK